MEKIMLFVMLAAFITVVFAGCSAPYDLNESVDEIISIEIVSAENSRDFTVEKTLSEIEKSDFLRQFQTMKFQIVIDPEPVYQATAIKITYQSGNYEMISRHAIEYVEGGIGYERPRSPDYDEFDELLARFSD